MKNLVALWFLMLLSPALLVAQQNNSFHYTSSPVMTVSKRQPGVAGPDRFPSLMPVESPKPGGEAYNKVLMEAKAQMNRRLRRKAEPGPSLLGTQPSPKIAQGFEGNLWTGVPNDNDMAISKSGRIISVVNSTIAFMDTTGHCDTVISLEAFSKLHDLNSNNQNKYDPRVVYDPNEDRFVLAYLSGNTDSTSDIIVVFSNSGHPDVNDWNYYQLPGDPLKDTSWSDYPIIALTDDHFILTINLLYNDSTWQAGFRQTITWQMDKRSGYSGDDELKLQMHSGFRMGNVRLRNMCPVQGGSKPVGGTLYFISTRNFAPLADSIFLVSMTGGLDKGEAKFDLRLLHADRAYGMPPNAWQPPLVVKLPNQTIIRYTTLATNDARALDAFIENGKIHFVGNTAYAVGDSMRAGIFHGIITQPEKANPKLQLNLLGLPDHDFGYPAIAYAGRNAFEDDALITMNYSGIYRQNASGGMDTLYPGCGGVLYRNGGYSDLVVAKKGTSYIDILTEDWDRWGDYSGAQTDYNHPGRVWMAATFGQIVTRDFSSRRAHSTWVYAVDHPELSSPPATPADAAANVYPQPADQSQLITAAFNVLEPGQITFAVYNLIGQRMDVLMTGFVQQGRYEFSFYPTDLANGFYVLKAVTSDGKEVFTEKFMVR